MSNIHVGTGSGGFFGGSPFGASFCGPTSGSNCGTDPMTKRRRNMKEIFGCVRI